MQSFKLQSVKLHVKTMMSTTIWPHADEEDHKPSSSCLIHGIPHLKTALLMARSLAETTTSHKAAIFSSIQFSDHTRGLYLVPMTNPMCFLTKTPATATLEEGAPAYCKVELTNPLQGGSNVKQHVGAQDF